METINNKLREDIEDNIERLGKGLTSAYGPAAGTLHSTFPAGVEGLSLVAGHWRAAKTYQPSMRLPERWSQPLPPPE